MTVRVIKTPEQMAHWVAFLKSHPVPCSVSVTKGVKRTDAQNRTLHGWFGEIALALGDTTPAEVKARCNLQYGRPILDRDNPEWASAFGYLFEALSYEAKLKAIRVLDLPFTRLMNVAQLSEYMDQMRRDYTEQGIYLTDPDLRGYEQR